MKIRKIGKLRFSRFAELYGNEIVSPDFFLTEERGLLEQSAFPFRSEGYIVGICTAGKATLEVNLHSFPAEPGTLLLTSPSQIIRIHETQDFVCRFVVFSDSLFVDALGNESLPQDFRFFHSGAKPVIQLNPENHALLLQIFDFIKQGIHESPKAFRLPICRSILTTMLYVIAGLYEKESTDIQRKKTRQEELCERFSQLLVRSFKKQRSVQFYADALFVSPKHLTETLRAVTGKTAGEWIDGSVLLEAKVLLRNTPMGIADIAAELHFPDQSAFGKFFKNLSGLSPNQYRKQIHPEGIPA